MTQPPEPPTNTATEEPEWLRLKRFCEEFDRGFFGDFFNYHGSITWNYLMWQGLPEHDRQKVRQHWLLHMGENLKWALGEESTHTDWIFKGIQQENYLTALTTALAENRLSRYGDPRHQVQLEIRITTSEQLEEVNFLGHIIYGYFSIGGDIQQKIMLNLKYVSLEQCLFLTPVHFHTLECTNLQIRQSRFLMGLSLIVFSN